MTFLSLDFLLFFFPATLAGYWALRAVRPRLAIAFLLAASAVFLFLSSALSLGILLASVTFNFFLAARIDAATRFRGALLAAGLCLNISILAWFKLFPALSSDSSPIFFTAGVPLGLSFYSFKQITFLIDRFSKRAPALPIGKYALFSMFFAHLPAGPITPYHLFERQLRHMEQRRFDPGFVTFGMSLFAVGAMKYWLFAGQLSELTAPIYRSALRGENVCIVEGWTASYGFLLELYYNFSAYSDMAIGLALCFGLRLSPNFDSPLRATSIGAYVMRWHMSLMFFARDYFFSYLQSHLVRVLPVARAVPRRILSWALATIATYFLIMMWHGATRPLFLIFIVSSVLVVGAALLHVRLQGLRLPGPQPGSKLLSNQLVIFLAATTIIFFRAQSLPAATEILGAMFDVGGLIRFVTDHPAGTEFCASLSTSATDVALFLLLVLGACVALFVPNTMRVFSIIADPGLRLRFRPGLLWGMAIALTVLIAAFAGNRVGGERFVYELF